MLDSAYHLPHNSIRVDEFNFMLNVIDLNKEYYSYSELRVLFFIEEIKQDVFSIFHSVPHANLFNHTNIEIKNLYRSACKGNIEAARSLLEKKCFYTGKKTWKQVWNEFVRDYVEFFAFIGVLPSYYKGIKGGENRHYVTPLLKRYREGKISICDLLLNFKFRNASKNHENYDMYSIEVRPFVLAIKILQHYYNNGYTIVNPHILSAIVTHSINEFENFKDNLLLFPNPKLPLDNYSNVFKNLDNKKCKEIGRATLLLKPYLKEFGIVEDKRVGRSVYLEILPTINKIEFSENSVYCLGDIGKYRLTPMLGKVLNICYTNFNQCLNRVDLFDENFDTLDQNYILEEFKNLGIISDYNENIVNISDKKMQYAINPYSDFFTITDAYYVDKVSHVKYTEKIDDLISRKVELKEKLDIAELRNAALGSDGTLYEETLYKFLHKHLSCFNITWYGQFTTGQRLSDLAGLVKIYENGEIKNILIIVECKAGNAIAAFDERKEREDIINTMKKYDVFSGVWYWVVDSNSLPNCNVHGGYRSTSTTKSFPEKLNELQFEINMQSNRPALVTAFSINALTNYLEYLVQSTQNIQSDGYITEVQVPHFWRWSKKFMNLQYTTIHQEIKL